MVKQSLSWYAVSLAAAVVLTTCAPASVPSAGGKAAPKVLATETFLADIAQNVAGDRLKVEALIPLGVDPHGFEPTPRDVKKVADSSMLIVNGAGLEEFLAKLLQNAGGQRTTIEAAAGLESRKPKPGEEIVAEVHGHEGDPHFWLDPVSVIKYVENIRDGLSAVDPDGAQVYLANAQAYITKLQELDKWAAEQMKQVPDDRRVLVTNHESLGYFADRYGLRIVGAIVPSVSTGASPSAQQLAQLADAVKRAGVKAIFLETGANPQLANQLARDAGIRAVTSLYTHSVTDAKGPAPTYIDMMKYNVKAIVDALR
jgi:ABC-type Zn uptake system ZnuABC Zn-binding protein ZnuA